MGVGAGLYINAGLYMYVVVVQKFTFAISSPDEFLYVRPLTVIASICVLNLGTKFLYFLF